MISQGNNQEVEQQFNQKHNNKKYWSNDEDTKLNSAVILHGSNWKIIAEYVPGRNASQCAQRWKRIKPKENERNQKWSQEEDEEVLRLTKDYSFNWRLISHHLPNRTGRQIRERFVNHLDPNILKSPWTEEEDKWIWNMYQSVGTKWSDMSKKLPGRPENMIKNRFYSYIRKQYGKIQNPYYVVPKNVRVLEKETIKKSKIIKKIKKYRKFCQEKRNQEDKQNKEQFKFDLEKQVQDEQQIINKQLQNYGYQQQQHQQINFPYFPTEYQLLQQPLIYYPYQFITSEFYGILNTQDMLSWQKEQMCQSTFSEMTKSQNNESQLQGQQTMNLLLKQIQPQQIVTKEEEIENPILENKITDSFCPLQIRADILKMIQKQNLQDQFQQ
ncbi:unnamed protein product [Paramecium sonneborni]|uniref:Uncharacterized protein n=1 Tax=Paramecium sonneborni TaxID=65129 RepID=A0A8S1P1V7_9CILI|nr:unnamed protein product [Paramecium sonneborni]